MCVIDNVSGEDVANAVKQFADQDDDSHCAGVDSQHIRIEERQK